MKKLLGALGLFIFTLNLSADQTGDCTAGEQYCEQNSLETTNTTTTTNTIRNGERVAYAVLMPNASCLVMTGSRFGRGATC